MNNEPTEPLKQNERVNQRINAFIKTCPDRWQYIQNLPRERLERAYALKLADAERRKERYKSYRAQQQERTNYLTVKAP